MLRWPGGWASPVGDKSPQSPAPSPGVLPRQEWGSPAGLQSGPHRRRSPWARSLLSPLGPGMRWGLEAGLGPGLQRDRDRAARPACSAPRPGAHRAGSQRLGSRACAMGRAGRWGGSSGCPRGGSVTGRARKWGGGGVGALGVSGPPSWSPAHLQPPRGPGRVAAQHRGPKLPGCTPGGSGREVPPPRQGRVPAGGGEAACCRWLQRESPPDIDSTAFRGFNTTAPGDTARSLSPSSSASAEAGVGGIASPSTCSPHGARSPSAPALRPRAVPLFTRHPPAPASARSPVLSSACSPYRPQRLTEQPPRARPCVQGDHDDSRFVLCLRGA